MPDETLDDLFVQTYDELRRLAQARMRVQKAKTLQPTAVVHEAYARLRQNAGLEIHDKEKFLATAATAMRRLLVDHHRRKKSEKRGGGGEQLPLDLVTAYFEEQNLDILQVHEALEALEKEQPEAARVAELQLFGGLEMPEIKAVLGKSLRTVERRWAKARAFLRVFLEEKE